MLVVWLRFYEELNDFLAPQRRRRCFPRTLPGPTSVKDLIESCGVPHTEIDLILLNSEPVGFDVLVGDGDRVSVYPVCESLDISCVTPLQERPLRRPRFLADVHLGKLARYLRLAGIDTAYSNHAADAELVERMHAEDRALLTRDRRLLMRRRVDKGYLVRSDRANRQLEEVVRRFDLTGSLQPWSRCIHCNTLLQAVAKDSIREQLEPLTAHYYEQFSRCPGCGQIYWAGSHKTRLPAVLRRLIDQHGQSRNDLQENR